jgi:hypothetical protein
MIEILRASHMKFFTLPSQISGFSIKSFNITHVAGNWRWGQTPQKNPSIAFLKKAYIHNGYNASIAYRSHQATNALAQSQDCAGYLEIEERLAAFIFNTFNTRLDNRITGNLEGQFFNNNTAQRLSNDIDSFPETGYSQ